MEIIFKIHSRCNLSCTYCYIYNQGDDSYLRMPNRVSIEVVESLVKMIEAHAERTGRTQYSLVFHGGEPLLVGKAYFREIMEVFKSIPESIVVQFGMQTNGILVDQEWIELFREYRVSLSASLDGPDEMNGLRVDHQGNTRTEEIERGVRRLHSAGLLGGVLAVLSPETDGTALVRYFRDQLELSVFNFLLPDHSHDDLPEGWANQQQRLGAVLVDGFEEWRDGLPPLEAVARKQPHISLFVDFVHALHALREGGGFSPALREKPTVVVETNGDLEIHDVMRIHAGYEKGETVKAGPHAIVGLFRTAAFMDALNPGEDFCQQCQDCRFLNSCGGGLFFHRFSAENGYLNPSVHCQALLILQKHIEAQLQQSTLRERPS